MKRTTILSALLVAGFVGAIGLQTASAGNWYDKVKVSADFRYRYESIVDQKDATVAGETYDTYRDRDRIRLRLKLEGHVNDQWKLVSQIATGSTDPADANSTNQTLSDEFSKKPFNLDKAYAEGKLFGTEEPIVTALFGKMSNPMENPGGDQILWDGDITPEGAAAKIEVPAGDMKVFSNVAGFWVKENSTTIDAMFYGIQAGVEMKLGDLKAKLGGGLNAFTRSPQTFGRNYNIGEAFLELGTKVGELPLQVFGHFAQNGGAADSEYTPLGATESKKVDTAAMAFGASLGKASKAGTYQAGIMYKKYGIASSLFMDSDFAGGKTDSSGVVVSAAYAMWDKTTIGATYIISQKQISATGDLGPLNYNRLQVDLSVKY